MDVVVIVICAVLIAVALALFGRHIYKMIKGKACSDCLGCEACPSKTLCSQEKKKRFKQK